MVSAYLQESLTQFYMKHYKGLLVGIHLSLLDYKAFQVSTLIIECMHYLDEPKNLFPLLDDQECILFFILRIAPKIQCIINTSSPIKNTFLHQIVCHLL